MVKSKLLFIIPLLIILSFQSVSAEDIKIGIITDSNEVQINPGETRELYAYIFNLGNKNLIVDIDSSNNGPIEISSIPSIFGLPPSNPTQLPSSEDDLYWWTLNDGHSFVALKKIRIYVTAPDSILSNSEKKIFNPTIHIISKPILDDLYGITQKVLYQRDFQLTVELINSTLKTPVKNPSNINLIYKEDNGMNNISMNDQDSEEKENDIMSIPEKQDKDISGPLISIETDKMIDKNKKKPFSTTTILIMALGLIIIAWLYFRK